MDGNPVAEVVYAETRRAAQSAEGGLPCLVSMHLATASPFSFYLKQQAKAAEKAGIRFRPESIPSSANAAQLRDRIRDLNADATVDAVLLEHPLPSALDFYGAIELLEPEKDVDGVGARNLGRLVARRPLHAPAVALAALTIARHYGVEVQGKRVAVVGRSETVGLPLVLLLLARGAGGDATVTVAHSKTKDMASALAGVEVIFSCAGQPGLLNRSTVPKGAAVIDVGTSSVPDPTKASGVRSAGDADPVSLDGWASALTPVPGGVGPVTSAILMRGAVEAHRLLIAKGRESGQPHTHL
jgi:methylenetetrahydrofolate dehydrogenase (NADP+)/methenyltetrahydrofolate cyclohydrolase